MDNLSSQKVAGVREAIETAGATLRLLPAYSSDPIEQAFAKLKALLRGRAMRTVEALWNGSAPSSHASPPPSAPTISDTQAISSQGEDALTCAACVRHPHCQPL
jgi:hypothetical protein